MSRRKERSVPFNFAMSFLLKLSGMICAAVSYPFAFRMIGEAGMGKAAFAASVGSFFLLMGSMGVSTYGIRECARVRDDPAILRQTARELILLQFLMTLASELLLLAAVIAVPRLWENRLLFLIQGAQLLFHALDTEWLFAAEERYGFLTVRSFTVKLAAVVMILLTVRRAEDYRLYVLFMSAAAVMGYLWNLLGAGRYLRGRGEKLRPLRHFRASAVFFLQAAAVTIYTGMDSVLLGFMKVDAAVKAGEAHESNPEFVNDLFGWMFSRCNEGVELGNEWICHDPYVQKDHAEDPFDAFTHPVHNISLRDFIDMMLCIEGEEWAKKVPTDLPVLLIAGDQDPVGNFGEGVYLCANWLHDTGHDVVTKLYSGYRHEIHNYDDIKDDVEELVIEWMFTRL